MAASGGASSNGGSTSASGGNGTGGAMSGGSTSGGTGSTNGGSTSGGSTSGGSTSGGSTSGGTATTSGGSTTTSGGTTSAGASNGGTTTNGGTTASGGTTTTNGGTATASGGTTTTSGGTTTTSGGTATTGGSGAVVTGPFGNYGQDTKAGSGGTVIKVTTLAASGTGSLAAALAMTGPRIIVFEVGGVIDLNRAKITISQPFVTVAGQTAPSPGITLIRGGLTVTTHDVKLQHLRFRMGDAGAAAASGFEPDVTTDGVNAYNIVFDHCSVAWGVDENLSVSGPRFDGVTGTSRNVTISNNIIAEGLYNSVHSKGVHSMGTLIHDYCTDIAVIGNFYAHNNERNPWFKGFARGVISNNLVYNPGVWAMRLGAVLSEWTSSGITPQPPAVSVIGNVMRYGTNTPANSPMVGSNSSGTAYLEDNINTTTSGASAPLSGAQVTLLSTKPAWPNGFVARPASQVQDWVLAHAGARPKDCDAVDLRLIADFKAGKGAFIDSQDQVGGYPTATPTQRTLTVPANVDAWLTQLATELE
ncbi:MAG: right-handed parallel beta-helix repeat-containing protein [Polyangiaceae bacterium]